MNLRSRWIAGGVVVLCTLAGIGIVLMSGADEERAAVGPRAGIAGGTSIESAAGDSSDLESVPADESAPGAETGTAIRTASGVATNRPASRRRAAAVRDTPAPPSRPSAKPTTPTQPADPAAPDYPGGPSEPNHAGDGLTMAERLYRKQTRAVVEADPTGLQNAAASVLAALDSGDEHAVEGVLAEDEGAQPEFLDYITDRYPPIVTSAVMDTVNIFASGDATIYMAYAQVVWEDAGISSQHTIPIPMRFIEGEWRLTSVEYWTDSLVFVQSVEP